MHMRKITVSLLGLALLTGLAIAQESGQSQNDSAPAAQMAPMGQRRLPNPARQARRLGRQLGLSPDQISQIEPVIANRQVQLENLRTDPTLTPQQRRAQARSIMRDSNSKLEAVMTDGQKQQFEQLMQARREARRQHRQEQAPEAAPQQQAPDAAPQQQAPQQAPQDQAPQDQAPQQ
jgi:periplasmic protein CpxP/Spy